MAYPIKRQYITMNRSYEFFNPIGCTIHETASAGATAQMNFNYFNTGDRNASAHAFVDWTQIIQAIPWNEKGWHAGATANKRYIGIELCRPKARDTTQFNEVWKRSVWLTAYLFTSILSVYTVNSNNLISHDEARIKFKDTTHTDPTGYFSEYGRTMNDFRTAVQAEINSMVYTQPAAPSELEDAVSYLNRQGVIGSPQYWLFNSKAGMTVRGENAASLIIKMAEKLRTVQPE
jgi:N-acetylmuramoyl-L-alanine amidase